MFELESLRKILDPSIKIEKICLSYVTRIFPQFKNTPYVILYKEVCYTFIIFLKKFYFVKYSFIIYQACKSIDNCSKFIDADQSNRKFFM